MFFFRYVFVPCRFDSSEASHHAGETPKPCHQTGGLCEHLHVGTFIADHVQEPTAHCGEIHLRSSPGYLVAHGISYGTKHPTFLKLKLTRWWFQMFFVFTLVGEMILFDVIFFKWFENHH